MSEGQVSADGETYSLPQPFMVIATQNPLEFEGTYPLPESQLDRFLLRISVGYPDRVNEHKVLACHRSGEPVDRLEPVLRCEQIAELQKVVREVGVNEAINDYLLDIVEATRRSEEFTSARLRAAGPVPASQAAALATGTAVCRARRGEATCRAGPGPPRDSKGYLHGGQRLAIEALVARLVNEVPVPR